VKTTVIRERNGTGAAVVAPAGATWEHEALPAEVIAWAEGLPGTLAAPPGDVRQLP
jgi:hypothetical protein